MIKSRQPSYIKAVYISLLIIIIIFFMIMAKKILVPLMLSGYIAMLLTPTCNRMEQFKVPRSLAAFSTVLMFLAVVTGIVIFIVTQVKNLLDDLQTNVMQNINGFALYVNSSLKSATGLDFGMGHGLDAEKIMTLLNGEEGSENLLSMTLGTVSGLLLFPVFIFFLLIYRDHIAVFITKVFEKQNNKILFEHVVAIRETVHAYLTGAGKVMIILAIVNTAVLFTLGIKHAVFFGITAGLLNIIPYLGPMLGAIMPFLFALLTKDNLFYPFAVVVSFTLIQLLESLYLTPKITGTNVSLNAFITFLALLIGGAIWGIAGMIIIIPTIAILKHLFALSPETEPYAYLFGEENTRWFNRIKKNI